MGQVPIIFMSILQARWTLQIVAVEQLKQAGLIPLPLVTSVRSRLTWPRADFHCSPLSSKQMPRH